MAPVFNGGSPVLDYNIWYSSSTNSVYISLVSGLTSLSYTATSLIPGTTYNFEVKARNIYGFGSYSNIATILAS